ncbi:MAG: hypothetical protein K0R75_4061 [Paenibacillaceae bacterium]|nr:hypothetical protein [Paenibacillaceae bacterium]
MLAKKMTVLGLTGAMLLWGTTAFADDSAAVTAQNTAKQGHQTKMEQTAEKLGIDTQGMDKKDMAKAVRAKEKANKEAKLSKAAKKMGIDMDDPDMDDDSDLNNGLIRDLIENAKLSKENEWYVKQGAKYGISRAGSDDAPGLSQQEFEVAVQNAYLKDPANAAEIEKEMGKLQHIAVQLNLDAHNMNLFQLRQAIETTKKNSKNNDLYNEALKYGVNINGKSRKDAEFAIRSAKQDIIAAQMEAEAARLGIDTAGDEDGGMSPDDIMAEIHRLNPTWKADLKSYVPAPQPDPSDDVAPVDDTDSSDDSE